MNPFRGTHCIRAEKYYYSTPSVHEVKNLNRPNVLCMYVFLLLKENTIKINYFECFVLPRWVLQCCLQLERQGRTTAEITGKRFNKIASKYWSWIAEAFLKILSVLRFRGIRGFIIIT